MSIKTVGIASLWDVDAKGLNASVMEDLMEPVEISGDVMLRARAHAARAGHEWLNPGSFIHDPAMTRLPEDYSRERRAYSDELAATEVPC